MTIVPLALGLATTMQSAEEAILLAANIGGDSDSVASIAGGILGAIDTKASTGPQKLKLDLPRIAAEFLP